MRVAFRRILAEARVPARARAGDAGYDLAAAEGMVLEPGGRAVARTGIAIALPDGYAGLVLPRSGLAARHGVTLINAPGLIDSGYRGEILIPLVNHDRESAFEVAEGMRIAQLVLIQATLAEFVAVDFLEESADGRGQEGFGSSGA